MDAPLPLVETTQASRARVLERHIKPSKRLKFCAISKSPTGGQDIEKTHHKALHLYMESYILASSDPQVRDCPLQCVTSTRTLHAWTAREEKS